MRGPRVEQTKYSRQRKVRCCVKRVRVLQGTANAAATGTATSGTYATGTTSATGNYGTAGSTASHCHRHNHTGEACRVFQRSSGSSGTSLCEPTDRLAAVDHRKLSNAESHHRHPTSNASGQRGRGLEPPRARCHAGVLRMRGGLYHAVVSQVPPTW